LRGILDDLFGPGTWGTGGNMVAWVLCGAIGGAAAFLLRHKIGKRLAAWWAFHHGPHAVAQHLEALRLHEAAKAARQPGRGDKGNGGVMTASAQGFDISSYQPRLDVAAIRAAGHDFGWAKATNGLSGEDPEFAASWETLLTAGVHRGAYHEMTGADPVAQARDFVAVVAGRGIRPGDMLAIVATDYQVSGRNLKACCDEVARRVGPHCPVLVYASTGKLPALGEASAYPLWAAEWRASAPTDVAPWHKWVFWQYAPGGGADGGDKDAFNGTAADLNAWIASYTKTAPAPVPVPPKPVVKEAVSVSITSVQKGSTGQAVKNWQGLLIARGYDLGTSGLRKDGVDGVFGDGTDTATRHLQASAHLPATGVVDKATYTAALHT
jgi:GH25 family lysozyme M1 (1,4-beta-N-acetylmuramidase)